MEHIEGYVQTYKNLGLHVFNANFQGLCVDMFPNAA